MSTATERNLRAQTSACFSYSAAQKRILQRKLLAWYDKHARDLPWRQSYDPYRVWVSEIMLQQTQVATVRDYFKRFIRAFPSVDHLAAAEEEDVFRLWEGLGYYRRARHLHAAARRIVAEHGGRFPRSADELRKLPGIGRYTAGAIASIAFGQRAPILEANTIRLLSRLIGYREDALAAAGQRVLWKVAEEILPARKVARFNQALMELGSLVCAPSEPRCEECPLSSLCVANSAGMQQMIPLAKPKTQYTELRETAVIVCRGGRVLMRQCGRGERWAGLWDFPRFEVSGEGPLFIQEEIVTKLRRQTGITCEKPALLKSMRHGVTRYRITLDCYQARFVAGRARSSNGNVVCWVGKAKLSELPLSTTGRKIADLMS